MRVAMVTGTRRETRRNLVAEALEKWKPDMLIVGDAKGVDAEARQWAICNGVSLLVGHANWKLWGPSAGPKRNAAMADTLEAFVWGPHQVMVFAVPDGNSVGTHDAVRACKARGLPIVVLEPKRQPRDPKAEWEKP